VVHVKLDDTANAVAKVLAEKAAGKNEGGSVDLIWINGENFASMKRQELLMAPDWTTGLPNWAYVDHENKPTITDRFHHSHRRAGKPLGRRQAGVLP
jgi:putative thiamine transport system substrate-binding protein